MPIISLLIIFIFFSKPIAIPNKYVRIWLRGYINDYC
nr:MAG TPA: Protein of unknown function (DUF3977) [Caudoviricetes sp.]